MHADNVAPGPDGRSGASGQVVIIGAGGHGRELVALVADGTVPSDLAIMGFVDDGAPDARLLARIGTPHLGSSAILASLAGRSFVVGIGAGTARLRLAELAERAGLVAAQLVSARAHVGPDVRMSPGCVIFPMATVTTNIDLGRHVHVGRGAAVGHDSVLGDAVTVMPNASVSGNVVIGEGATVGTGAAVIQGVTIGTGATVGAGAAVVRDVPDHATVVGVPARPL